jgi:hypothetical protein
MEVPGFLAIHRLQLVYHFGYAGQLLVSQTVGVIYIKVKQMEKLTSSQKSVTKKHKGIRLPGLQQNNQSATQPKLTVVNKNQK